MSIIFLIVILSNIENNTTFFENIANKIVMPIQNGLVYIKNKCLSCDKIFVKQYKNSIGKRKGIDYLKYCTECRIEHTINTKYDSKEEFYKHRYEAYKQTCNEKYGVDNVSQLDTIKEKKEQTSLKNRGTKYYIQTKKGRLQYEKTMEKKYGKKHALQVKEFNDKFKDTVHDKYSNKEEMNKINEKRRKTTNQLYNVDNVGLLNHHYRYDDIGFDSSWELCFYVYHKDKCHKIEREPTRFEYFENKKLKVYIPDFKVNNIYYEIKGDHYIEFYKNGKIKTLKNNKEKYKCMKKHNVRLIWSKQIEKYLKYVYNVYGKNFIDNCKI